MNRRRALLAITAVVGALVAAALTVTDIRFEDRTCGSAMIATDPSRLVVLSGDAAIDDFEGERLSGSCHRRVLERRFVVLVPLTVTAVCAYLARREQPGGALGT